MVKARAPIGLVALAAMLGAHWVAYALAISDAHTRADLLQTTGHGYWPSAVGLAIVALVLGLGAFVGQHLSPEVRVDRRRLFSHVLGRFLALQIGGFTALELVERIVSGHSASVRVLLGSTFVVGLVIQVVSALVCAVLLVLVAAVIERIVAVTSPLASGTIAPLPLVSLLSASCLVPATGARTLRGPPVRA